MHKYSFLFVFCLLLGSKFSNAQSFSEKHLQGVYVLNGVNETAAAIKLNPDHTFDYKFTFGVANKWGKGTWKLDKNQLVLTSKNTRPEKDFILAQGSSANPAGLKVKVCDSLGRAYIYVACRLGGEQGEIVETNELGEAVFSTVSKPAHLELFHQVYSTRISAFDINDKTSSVIFQPACDLSEIFFAQHLFVIKADNTIQSTQLPGFPESTEAGKSYVFSKK
jgi:hypothetical protein